VKKREKVIRNNLKGFLNDNLPGITGNLLLTPLSGLFYQTAPMLFTIKKPNIRARIHSR